MWPTRATARWRSSRRGVQRPAATYSASGTGATALAFDPSGNLYVADSYKAMVEKFAPGSSTPSATYSAGLSGPVALALDSSGNLYVANYVGNTVEKFAPGSTTASATYSTGLSGPGRLAFDSSGNLYVANLGNNTVEKFAPGSTTAAASYSAGVNGPDALAFDSSGNLYVANFGNNTVEKFSPAITIPAAASVVIQSSVESRPMLIGGTNNAAVAGINLTKPPRFWLRKSSRLPPARSPSATASRPATSRSPPRRLSLRPARGWSVVQEAAGAGEVVFDDGARR